MDRKQAGVVTIATLLALCGQAGADVQREVVAVTREPAGATGGLFSAFGNARLNEEGEVLFWARRTMNVASSNDECASAIPIGLGGTFITTAGATASVPMACGANADVWFEFTDTSNADNTVVQFYPAGAEFGQSAIGIYLPDCTTLIQCASIPNIATFNFTPAVRTVRLRLGSFLPGQSGDAMIVARVASGTPAPVGTSVTDGALWLRNGTGLGPILQEGSVVAFDPTLVHESMSIAAFTDFGAVVTGAVQATPRYAVTRAAMMSLPAGQVGVGVLAIDTVPPSGPPVPPPLPTIPGPAALSADGIAAFALLDGSSLTYGATTHLTGTAAPGLAGLTWLNFDQPASSATAKVAWRSRLAGTGVGDANDVALWKDPGTGPVLVVRSGQQAPAAKPGVVFGQIGADIGIDAAGGVAFWAELTGPGVDASNRSGVWTDRGGSLVPAVRAGQLTGLDDTSVFSAISRRPMMNAAGDIAALAFASGGGVTASTNSAIWVFRANGSRRVLAREGDAAPGAGEGAVFATFSEPVINDRGDVAFVATLRGPGVTPQTAQVLYFGGAERGLVPLARSGEIVTVSGIERIIRELQFGTGRPQAGQGQFNSSGEVLYEMVFADRTSALVKTTVTCPADFDASGVVAVPDIFAYLSAWFSQQPGAEWDGAEGLTVADLFAFLSQWFAGC